MAGSPEHTKCPFGQCPVDRGTRARNEFIRGAGTAANNQDWGIAAKLEDVAARLDDTLHEIVAEKDELCSGCRYRYSPLLERPA